MNALAQTPKIYPLGNFEEFIEVCETQYKFVGNGWITKQLAVDNLQNLAERWLLIDEFGQDAAQAIMSAAFCQAAPNSISIEAEYEIEIALRAGEMVRRWEAAEAQKPQALPSLAPVKRAPASSTVDAFFVVVSLADPDRLAKWLRDHPDDTPHLMKLIVGGNQ